MLVLQCVNVLMSVSQLLQDPKLFFIANNDELIALAVVKTGDLFAEQVDQKIV